MMTSETRARLSVLGSVLCATLFILPFKSAATGGRGAGAAVGLMFFVTLFFTPWGVLRWRKHGPVVRAQSYHLAWKMGIFAALGNIAQGFAFELLHAGVAATFIQMNILFVALLSVFWLGEALKWGTVLGMALAIAGVAVTQWSALSGHFELSVGVLWAVLAAFGFSCMDILSRRDAHGVDAVITNAGRAGIATVLLACLPGALDQFFSMDAWQIAACALAALLGPGLGRLLLISASRKLPAAESALIQQLRPPLALPLTSLVFGVWPSQWEWWGSILVAAGVVVPLTVAMKRPS